MTDSPKQLAADWDSRADAYDQSGFHTWLASRVGAFLVDAPLGRVLDIATGTGLALAALDPEQVTDLTGIDISPGMLKVAADRLPDASFTQGDASTLPFEPATFDTVLCVAGMSFFEPRAAFAEWSRVLKSGGRIVFTVHADDSEEAARRLEAAADAASEFALTVLRSEASAFDGHAPDGRPDRAEAIVTELALSRGTTGLHERRR